MDCNAISVLTSLLTSNATNVLFAGFPNNKAQNLMLHLAITSLVCLFCSSVSATKLQEKYEAGAKFFHGLATVFSAMFVAMVSACILPAYHFKWVSCLLCLVPVIVHTLSEPRWAFDWLSNAPLLVRWFCRLFR